MRKNEYWRTRLFRDGEQRYIEEVIRPALADLSERRQRLQERMPVAESDDDEVAALFQGELRRMDAFEARLSQHLIDSRNRFSRLAGLAGPK